MYILIFLYIFVFKLKIKRVNYAELSKNYKPNKIKTLLIGEAPPQSGKSYFYLPVDKVYYRSLPGTIFIHYFGILPQGKNEYVYFLNELKRRGIWIIDITDEPVQVWINRKKWIKNPNSINTIVKNIPVLKNRILDMGINEKDIIFLLARTDYIKNLRIYFPLSRMITWSKFRNV